MTDSSSAAREAILADPRSVLPLVHQLLGAYFHQDWAADTPAWTAVVDDFIAESSPATVAATAAQLRHLARAGFDDATLRVVLEALDSGLDPRGVGLDADAWLAAVVQRLDG